jgi:hypothetical protein
MGTRDFLKVHSVRHASNSTATQPHENSNLSLLPSSLHSQSTSAALPSTAVCEATDAPTELKSGSHDGRERARRCVRAQGHPHHWGSRCEARQAALRRGRMLKLRGAVLKPPRPLLPTLLQASLPAGWSSSSCSHTQSARCAIRVVGAPVGLRLALRQCQRCNHTAPGCCGDRLR